MRLCRRGCAREARNGPDVCRCRASIERLLHRRHRMAASGLGGLPAGSPDAHGHQRHSGSRVRGDIFLVGQRAVDAAGMGGLAVAAARDRRIAEPNLLPCPSEADE